MSTAQTNCRFSWTWCFYEWSYCWIHWSCFQDGIKSCAALPSDFDPRCAQLACSRIYRLTEKGSTAATSMYDIPKFWINLNGLVQNSNLNAMECCITRVFCMQGALIFHRWLSDVVLAAVNGLWCPKCNQTEKRSQLQLHRLSSQSCLPVGLLTQTSELPIWANGSHHLRRIINRETLASVSFRWIFAPSAFAHWHRNV